MSLGENLKKLRNKRGLSQYDVAEKLGIKRGRYNTWENGIAKPRYEMLEKLCDFYRVSMNELTGDKDHYEDSNETKEENELYLFRYDSSEFTDKEKGILQKDLEDYFTMRKKRILEEREKDDRK